MAFNKVYIMTFIEIIFIMMKWFEVPRSTKLIFKHKHMNMF